jgi:hypothetical protein
MSRSGQRSPGAVALVALAAMLLALGLRERAADSSVPAAFRYVAPNATGYLVTGPLQVVWTNGPRHLSRVFSDNASQTAREFARNVDRRLEQGCLKRSDLSELATLGVDGSRAAALSLLTDRVVAVLPVSDVARLEAFVSRIAAEDVVLSPDALPPGRRLKMMRIDANRSRGVLLCREGTIVDPRDGVTSPGPELRFSVGRVAAAARLELTCTAVFVDPANEADESTGGCICRFGGSDCARGLEVPGPVETRQLRLLDDRMAAVVFDNEQRVLAQNDDTLVSFVETAASSTRNWQFFRRDDSLRSTLRYLTDGLTGDDGLLAGAVKVPAPPISGRLHFSVGVSRDSITARLLTPWEALQFALLDDLAAPAQSNPSGGRLSSLAELRVSDPALGRYLRAIDDANEGSLDRMYFGSFLREITRLNEVGELHLGILGVRDGVPDLAMSLSLEASEAEDLLFRQREQMRRTRDLEILRSAAKAFATNSPHQRCPHVAELAASGYLMSGPGALWSRYRGSDWSQSCGADPRVDERSASGLVASDFTTADYEVADAAGRRLRFVSPPFTDDDLRYRVSEDARSDERFDAAALKNGRFRMAAYVDEAGRRLIVATDRTTLTAAIDREADVEPDADSTGFQVGKLAFFADPHALVSQGLLHASQDVNDAVTDSFLDFDQYRGLRFRIDPVPGLRAIGATLVLSHE